MAEPSIPKFMESLGASRLLTAAQFQLLKKQLVGNPLTAEGLSQVLVRQKHLTEWQAKQLLKGQSGFVLNQYRLLNPIGRGGMGHVFRGLDVSTNAVVAVKVMAKRLTSNETLVSRFRREIRASSQLDSPHIVRALDAGRVGKVDFLVMEYVNGDQVDRIANYMGRVPPGLACEIIRQVAEGLQHAHERRMVHRDIKPSNLMINWEDSGQGVTKLMDMGLVLVMSEEGDDHTVTRAGQVMGTPDYMSPEQGWDTTQVDIRGDIYSLGCTLFRMLTGKVPFAGSNPLQVLSQRLQRDAPTVRSVCPDIAESISDVVSKMTLRDPDARYQTPAEVAEALEAFCEPLLRRTLQAAAKTAPGDMDAQIAQPASQDVDEADVTYQSFLSEVEKGREVDLMLTTVAETNMHASTMPALDMDLNLNINSQSSMRMPRPGMPRGQRAGFIAMGLSAVVLIAVLIATVISKNGAGNSDEPSPDPQVTTAPKPTGSFGELFTGDARTGQWWSQKIDFVTSDITGTVSVELGESTPADVMYDDELQKVIWDVPASLEFGVYEIPLALVHVSEEGEKTTLAEQKLVVNVKLSPGGIKLPELTPFELSADTPFKLSIATSIEHANAFDLVYDIFGQAPDGLQLDNSTGLIQWVPTAADIGRVALTVAVREAHDDKHLDKQNLTLVVLPGSIEHVLPDLTGQKAVAGEKFEFRFPPITAPRMPRLNGNRVIEIAGGAPDGMVIRRDNSGLTWDVPIDATGSFSVRLKAGINMSGGRRRRELAGTRTLSIEIERSQSPPKSPLTMPSPEELEKTVAELRNTYKARLSAARTTPQRVALADELLMVSRAEEAGLSDAALLRLIEEDLAIKARAVDILFDIGTLRASRYGTSEIDEALASVAIYRRAGLEQSQVDLIVEHGLRLANLAAVQRDYSACRKFLELVAGLVRGSTGAATLLVNDVSTATDLCKDLLADDGQTTSTLKENELQRLLQRWQFDLLFPGPAGLTHFAISDDGEVAPNGQDLWKIAGNDIELTAQTRKAVVGILNTVDMDRFVLRLDVLPDTTALDVLIGARGSTNDDFAAVCICLDASGPGRIISIRDRSNTLLKPIQATRLLTNRPNHAEIVVDGALITVRLNGILLIQSELNGLTGGRIGLATLLAAPSPKASIRNLRLLKLPDSP